MNTTSRAIALRWFNEVWNQRRSETIFDLLAPEGVGHLEGQRIVGPQAFLAVYDVLTGMMPDLKVTVDDVVADADDVVVRWTLHATHTGAGLGCEPSGQTVAQRGMTWFKIRDGQIVEGWDSWNQESLLQTLREAVPV